MSKQNREQNRTEKAAAVRAQQARQERNKKVGMAAVIVLVLGAIIAGGVWLGAGSGGEEQEAPQVAARAGDHSLIIGEESAPVKVVVYEDFQCPFCREFESSTRDFLKEYAADGTVQVEYRPFHLLESLPYSGRALNAFAATLQHGTPEQALKLHDVLFENQPYEQSSDSVSEADIRGWVEDTGAGAEVVNALESTDEQFLQAATQAAVDAGVQGTPTVLVNGEQLTGNQSVGQMADELEQMLAEADR